jgi:hypothetical protein
MPVQPEEMSMNKQAPQAPAKPDLLDELNRLISDGYEFPDAVSYCVRRYKCSGDSLTELYDAQFV